MSYPNWLIERTEVHENWHDKRSFNKSSCDDCKLIQMAKDTWDNKEYFPENVEGWFTRQYSDKPKDWFNGPEFRTLVDKCRLDFDTTDNRDKLIQAIKANYKKEE